MNNMNNINNILIINHSVFDHTKKSHFPIMADNLKKLNKKYNNFRLINTNNESLKKVMIENSNYEKKYIIIYGMEIKMLKNFFNNYLILSLNLKYIIYFGVFLVNESSKLFDDLLDKYMKGNIRFFVDSYILQETLKNNVLLCFPFLNKELFNKINNDNKIETEKNTVFIHLRKLSYPFLLNPNKYKISLLFGLINIIKTNPDHYFYIDDQINNKIINIFNNNLKNNKNWEYINQSDDYEKYLEKKRQIEKHIMLFVSWNKYRTSGNILEMVALNRMIILIEENNWCCNFLHTIQYPNVIYVKSFFNLQLKDLPEIQKYKFYDQFINFHSIESILNLIPDFSPDILLPKKDI